MIYTTPVLPDELYHFGMKGMKWGVRRYQNPDGTYTEEGKRRRRSEDGDISSEKKGFNKKKAIKIGAAVVGTALAAYGAYKVGEYVKTNNAVKDVINRLDILPRKQDIEESSKRFAESMQTKHPKIANYEHDYNLVKKIDSKELKKDMAKGGRYDNLRKNLVKDQINFNKTNRINKIKDTILPEGYYKRDEEGHRTNEWIKVPRVKSYSESPLAKYEERRTKFRKGK